MRDRIPQIICEDGAEPVTDTGGREEYRSRLRAAVPAREQYVEVTVQGLGRDTVVLRGLNARVEATGAPQAWNSFLIDNGCCETVETQYFAVDLDEAAPRVTPGAGQRGFPYTVTENDPLVFSLRARTTERDVLWYLELEWSSGARHGTLRIDDQGRPFRTSGLAAGRTTYGWAGSDEWAPASCAGPEAVGQRPLAG